MQPVSRTCEHLASPNPWTVFLAAFILVGILVSYLPQHIKIISRRSSEGLSPWWVLLGGLSGMAAIANILVLPASRADMRCCKEVSGGECAAALLGVAQIGLQWSCFMFIVLLFLIFFPTDDVDLTSSTASLTHTPPPKRRDAVIVGISMLLALLTIGIASLVVIFAFPHHVAQTWANILGTGSSALAMVQYLPQIYFTWQMGEIKSLSILTMLIQVPGAFLFALSLWLRVGWEGWSTWTVFIVTGFLQAFLLALAIRYYFAARREEVVGDSDGDSVDRGAEGPSETTALLPDRSQNGKPSTTRRRSAERRT